MLAGPVFTREAAIAPRRRKLYWSRVVYLLAMVVLMLTLWMLFTGTQVVRNVGDLARFGHVLFLLIATLQLIVVVFFSALSTASAVSIEKDRRTLELLLMTRLSDLELVLGKLTASLLGVLVLLTAAVPFFLLATLFGGVSFGQIVRLFAVTLLSAVAAGSLGALIALWRERTFQTLALTALCLLFWPAICEAATWAFPDTTLATVAAACSPVRAILLSTHAAGTGGPALSAGSVTLYLLCAAAATVVMNGLAIWGVRVWNPTRESSRAPAEEHAESVFGASEPTPAHAERYGSGDAAARRPAPLPASTARPVWDRPIIWREMCTWAYGRKVIFVRVAYLLLGCLSLVAVYQMSGGPHGYSRQQWALSLAPLFVVSMLLINAQGVTALTNERDGRALDLLLVTDVTPREFVFGKLGGVFYNTKEMIAMPLVSAIALGLLGVVSLENALYLVLGLLVMDVFVAMLGIHAGMAYANSATAIATSLGTVFFLFVGVATCMWMMVAFGGGAFQVQLAPFVAFMLGGGIGLYVALGSRNPSHAIGVASILCPFATFYAITSFKLNHELSVLLVVVCTYGFTTAAMLVPAIYEFDVATGRTPGADE